MPDPGIYFLLRKKIAATPKASQVLTLPAYNQIFDIPKGDQGEFFPNYCRRWGRYYHDWYGGDTQNAQHLAHVIDEYRSSWVNYPRWYFVQDCDHTGIMTRLHWYMHDADWTDIPTGNECRFKFPSPGPSSGTIDKVTIWAQCQGQAKTLIRHSGTNYYGTLYDGEIVMGWIHTDYTSKPWGGSWSWSDLAAGTLVAGVWMEMGYSVYTHGGSWAAEKYFFNSSLCKRIKVIIEWSLNGVSQTPIELWPNDDDSTYGQSYGTGGFLTGPDIWIGNLFLFEPDDPRPWEDQAELLYDLWGPIPASVYSTLKTIPPAGSTINQLKLSYKVSSRDYYGQETVKPFLKIGGTKYYGTERTLPIQSYADDFDSPPSFYSNSHTWTTNPATSQAWTYSDLAGVTYGLEFAIYAAGQYLTNSYYIYSWDLEIKYDGASYTHNIHGDLSSNHTLSAKHNYPRMQAYRSSAGSRLWHSNLAELPPKNSQVNSLKIDFSYYGFTETDDSYHTVKPFLYINGSYYYGDAVYLGQDPLELHEEDFTWTTNPATSQAWAEADLYGLQWGIKLETTSSREASIFMDELAINIDHSPDAYIDTIEYLKLDARKLYSRENYQIPINPDQLHFSSNQLFPETAEVAEIIDGQMTFHGLIWTRDQLAGDYLYKCFSMEILLNYRFLPDLNRSYVYTHQSRFLPGFTVPYLTLNEFFNDDPISYPFWQFPYANGWSGLVGAEIPDWTRLAYSYSHCDNQGMGLFFLANSILNFDDDGTNFINVDPRIINRPIYATNHNSTLFIFDFTGGFSILSPVAGTPKYLEYHYDSAQKTLAIDNLPGSMILAADHLYETYLRPGDIENGEEVTTIQTIPPGCAMETFNSILNQIGREIRFRKDFDGFVYTDIALMIGRGSSTDPVKKYKHGIDNCTVERKIPDPKPDLVLGTPQFSSRPVLSSDWARSDPFFEKIITFDDLQFIKDMETAADSIFQETLDAFRIYMPYDEIGILPGDWIWAASKDRDYTPVRIMEIQRHPGETEIIAGPIRKPSPVDGWVNAIEWKTRKTTEIWPTIAGRKSVTFKKWCWLSKSVDFEWSGPTGSQTFVIPADDAQDPDGLAVHLELSWDLWKGGGVETGVINGPNTGTLEFSVSGNTPVGVYEILCTYGVPGETTMVKWRHNGGAWSAALDVYYKFIWPTPPGYNFPDENGDPTGIIVTANGYTNGRTDDSWSIAAYPVEYACRSDLFLILKVNGKIIPPGRIKVDGNSGSIEMDISEYCTKSSSSDTTNTFEATLVYGYPASTTQFCHKLSGTISQFKRSKVIINA